MGNIQQREELHRTIWAMADELRGQAGGWESLRLHMLA